jgi:hypothetical protein
VEERPVPELLRQASVVLVREVGKIPRTILDGVIPNLAQGTGLPGFSVPSPAYASGRACPVTGAGVSPAAPGSEQLRQQAHELLGSLWSLWNPGAAGPAMALPGVPGAGALNPTALNPTALNPAALTPGLNAGALNPTALNPAALTPGLNAGALNPGALYPAEQVAKSCPVTRAALPTFPVQRDELRRRAHELIETLLITFNEATGEKGLPTESQVPLVSCVAPVQPGDAGRVTLSVANEETTPTEVTLYSTNFVADQGYEIPSLRVTILPRVIRIPAGGKVEFEVTIAVPRQTPKGYYSGLVQAMGSKYFKAVLSMEVL